MSKSFILLLAILGGALALFGWLLHGSNEVKAATFLERPALDPTELDPAKVPAFLSQLVLHGDSSQPWDRGELEPQRMSAAEQASLAPLLNVAMDWTLPRRDWHRTLRTLFDRRLIDALRDDQVKWNASATTSVLRDRLEIVDYATETRRALERALVARDVDKQEERLCAGLLQVHALRGQGNDPHFPSDGLLEYSIGLIKHGSHWGGHSGIVSSVSGRQTIRFALAYSESMAEGIARALIESGPEESFVHAFLLGKSGHAEYAHLAAPILVDHLRDNKQDEDALMSLEALRALGDKASPWLWSTLRRSDVQQEYCIRLLLEEAGTLVMNPDSVAAQKEPLTWKCENPVQSWSFLENSQR